jgi:hypothetical protein
MVSGLPYAKRHWTASNEDQASCTAIWGHRIIALLEIIPIIGALIGLIERIIACFNQNKPIATRSQQDLSKGSSLSINNGNSISKGNAPVIHELVSRHAPPNTSRIIIISQEDVKRRIKDLEDVGGTFQPSVDGSSTSAELVLDSDSDSESESEV